MAFQGLRGVVWDWLARARAFARLRRCDIVSRRINDPWERPMGGMSTKALSWMLISGLSLSVVSPAQVLSPEAIQGVLWGTLVGGLAGADCGQVFSGNSAAMGAGIGLAAGALLGWMRVSEARGSEAPPACLGGATGTVGSGRGYCASGFWVGSVGAWGSGFGAMSACPTPGCSLTWEATLAGAVSGALIGAGSGSWGTGLALGTAAGLLAGTVADQQAQKRCGMVEQAGSQDVTFATVASSQSGPSSLASPHAFISAQPHPNSTYSRPKAPSIPDAPLVPEATRF